MDQQKRLLLTIVLSTAVMVLWMQFFGPKPPPAGAPDASVAAKVEGQAKPAELAAPAQPQQPAAPVAVAEEAAAPKPEQRIQWSTPAHQLEFTNRGGGLSKATVKQGDSGWPGYKFEIPVKGGKKGEVRPVELVTLRADQSVPGASEITGDAKLPLEATFDAEKTDKGVVFRGGNGQVGLEKSFEVNPNGFDMRARYSVTNRSGEPKKLQLSVAYPAFVDPATQEGGSFFAPPPDNSQAIARHEGSVERMGIKEGKQQEESWAGPVSFVGLDQRYFLGALFPKSSEGTSTKLAVKSDGSFDARLVFDLGEVKPGETVSREVGLYLGPKSLDTLKKVSDFAAAGTLSSLAKDAPAPGAPTAFNPQLDEAIDFGWWAVICRALLVVMKAFQKIVSNWGVAIILLTVLVKVLLYPLSHKQMESMEHMRRLQPQINELNKKYANDPEKKNLEQMRLFQENKVNPFGGCLPLLVQMPVWFALYRTLLTSFELYREPLTTLWIADMTQPDPFFVLPLAMGVTMFVQQKLQPQMGDPTQAKMMLYFMPIFFTATMLFLPAGLTLYIFTNNLLSIAQQKWLQHRFKVKVPTGPAVAGAEGK